MGQPTGYGRIANEMIPRIASDTRHEIVHHAISGLNRVLPFTIKDVRVYGQSSLGGELGMYDVPEINRIEGVDLNMLNFDCWAVSQIIQQFDFPFVVYPPIDHDPLPKNWKDVLVKADWVVPYCKFGLKVLEQWVEIDDRVDHDLLYDYPDYIYHGVDTDTYKPDEDVTKKIFDVDEDVFVVMLAKNNQGTRWKPVRQLRAFKMFLEEVGEDNAMMYLHSNIQGKNSFNLSYMIPRLGLGDNVKLVNQGQYRWGLPEKQLAALYSASDVLLNCTSGEGFGLPIIEAFSCETPVIGTGFSSMPELISGEEGEIKHEEGEESFITEDRGILVPTWDVEPTLGKHSWRRTVRAEDIKEALLWAYENREDLKEMGVNARTWAEANCSWDVIAPQWFEFFDRYEDEFYREDDLGIQWKKLGNKDQIKGGVGGWQR